MPSETVKQLEEAYASGEMEDLKDSILPFLCRHKGKLLEFMEEFQRVEGPCPLDLMVKIFIIQLNMPFCMRQYMARQSSTIQQDLAGRCDDGNRQAVTAEWIRQKAEAHRSQSMFRQVFCFEKLKGELLPVLRRELKAAPAH